MDLHSDLGRIVVLKKFRAGLDTAAIAAVWPAKEAEVERCLNAAMDHERAASEIRRTNALLREDQAEG